LWGPHEDRNAVLSLFALKNRSMKQREIVELYRMTNYVVGQKGST
jgi:hypothetical protein